MPNIIKDGYPCDDYALPKGLDLHDEYDEPGNWARTKRKEQDLIVSNEQELDFDQPRWGEMGGGEGDE